MTLLGRLSQLGPEWRIGASHVNTYRVAGHAGLLLASAVALSLAHARGLSVVLSVVVLLAGYPTIVAVTFVRKLITGRERLASFHVAIAYLLAVGGIARVAGAPALPYLDVTAVGVLTVLVVGRLGCFATGCCYGRPHPRGVAGEAHVRAGLPRSMSGVRLVPVQLLDAGVAGVAASAGAAGILMAAPVGWALAACTVLYAAGRFVVEFFRAEPHRRHIGGLSEAQAISASLCLIFGLALWVGWPTDSPWLWAIAWSTVAAAFVRVLRAWARPDLVSVSELAHVAHLLAPWRTTPPTPFALRAGDPAPSASLASRGLMVSASAVPEAGPGVGVVSFSRCERPLHRRDAGRLGRLAQELSGASRAHAIASAAGVVHVVVEGMTHRTGRTDAL
ncbi:MAG: prolipoprotein diacylglyceryl transferase [Gemmatimonadota bacterium]